jgi:hypothetical protein
MSGAGQNECMRRTLLFVLALAVIPVGVDAQADYQAASLATLRHSAEVGKDWNAAVEIITDERTSGRAARSFARASGAR